MNANDMKVTIHVHSAGANETVIQNCLEVPAVAVDEESGSITNVHLSLDGDRLAQLLLPSIVRAIARHTRQAIAANTKGK